ncbi:hypothetical protein EVAR_26693_1 [Eumeta japonica]|uniref:Uncharacterized protein n=1 Tax=Eumeta variegata TaxID=151549 RepID=A0A4C1VM75_EUMVA|nr:hypothetical protein EVAR_26693_1 [Eumeta japonica]
MGKSINSDLYYQQLTRLEQEVERKRPESSNKKSPDLAPSDLDLFRSFQNCLAGHTFDCNPDPTSVFDPSSVLRFDPGPSCGSVPIRFHSRPVRNSLPHSAFNSDLATSHNSYLYEAGTYSRGKRATEPSSSRWLPPPMDTRHPRGISGALLASWEGIGFLMEGDRVDGRGREVNGLPELLLTGRKAKAEDVTLDPCSNRRGINKRNLEVPNNNDKGRSRIWALKAAESLTRKSEDLTGIPKLASLATLDDSKPEYETILAKEDADFLRIFELADSIRLDFNNLGYGKESKRTVEHSSNSASSADAGGLISPLPTLSLTQFSGLDQEWLLLIIMFNILVNSRTNLTMGQNLHICCTASQRTERFGTAFKY